MQPLHCNPLGRVAQRPPAFAEYRLLSQDASIPNCLCHSRTKRSLHLDCENHFVSDQPLSLPSVSSHIHLTTNNDFNRPLRPSRSVLSSALGWFLPAMSLVPPSKGSPPAQKITENRRPRTNQRLTVSFDDDDESDPAANSSRLQYEVAECVETKTITTTTTTKRSFPPLFIRQPRALEALDSKEYPLAHGPTPPDLRKFSLDLNENDDEFSWSFPVYEPASPRPEYQVSLGQTWLVLSQNIRC